MEKNLDLSNLLSKAEDMVHDGKLDMADNCTIPIQEIELDNGAQFKITLCAKKIN